MDKKLFIIDDDDENFTKVNDERFVDCWRSTNGWSEIYARYAITENTTVRSRLTRLQYRWKKNYNLRWWIFCGVNVVWRICQFRADVNVFGPQQTRCIVFQGVPWNGRTAHSNSTAGYAGSIITYGGAQAPDSGKHNPLQGTIGYRVNAPRWVKKYLFYILNN